LTLQPYGTDQGIMTARNVVNQQVYTIRVYLPPTAKHPFKPGLVVYGTLVPWRGEWYWSGSQKIYEQISEQDEKDIRRSMLEELSSIAYRYCPEMAALARKYTRQLHEKFVQYYGTDLKVFPDGRTAAAMEGQRTDLLKIVPGAAGQEQAQGASEQDFGKPDDLFPPDFHNNTQGIAVFSQPEEEPEYMRDFNQLLSGMRKQGVDLSPDEASAVRGVMIAEVLSPALVRRVVAEHGPESILAAFQLHGAAPDVALEFLLRRYKGEFFRKRYPTLSLAGLDESLAKQSQAAGQSGVSAPSQPPA
ncbi:MAG TPA: hypothetical protein VEC99_14220, partial [Clostridia bacterium]|nr:hypothetical protein [Clostridia bacterium]